MQICLCVVHVVQMGDLCLATALDMQAQYKCTVMQELS